VAKTSPSRFNTEHENNISNKLINQELWELNGG